MGTWQHGMNPVTFFDFTSCEKAGRLFFKSSNQICCDLGSEIIREKRPTRQEFGGRMLKTIMVLQLKEDGKNGPNTTLPFHVSCDSDG